MRWAKLFLAAPVLGCLGCASWGPVHTRRASIHPSTPEQAVVSPLSSSNTPDENQLSGQQNSAVESVDRFTSPGTISPESMSPEATSPEAMSPANASISDLPDEPSTPALPTSDSKAVVPVAYEENSPAADLETTLVAANAARHSTKRRTIARNKATSTGIIRDTVYSSRASHDVCGQCESGCVACGVPTCDVPAGPPRRNAQEYIFDGGDQQPTVVIREDWSAAGVDPTDTVVYYETLGGQVCVKPTNRVPIYAPRFGAVRQVTGAFLASRAVGTERVLAPVKPGRFDETNLTGTVKQPLAPQGEAQVNLIDAFQENQLGTPIAQIVPPQRMSEALVPFEGINVHGVGKITDEEIAVLGKVLANARTWFVPESLGVMIEGKQVGLIGDAKRAQDIYVYESPDKCTLRICKTASHTIADSGDIVSFTIRFDNSGVKPVGNAVILDSLSPRLEYIEGSQQCSVDVQFTTEPNEVGSQVLKWEIIDPIQKSEGGVISFDCLVR